MPFLGAVFHYFPIVTACFGFLISFETVFLETNYVRTDKLNSFLEVQALFLQTPLFSHLSNPSELQCK